MTRFVYLLHLYISGRWQTHRVECGKWQRLVGDSEVAANWEEEG